LNDQKLEIRAKHSPGSIYRKVAKRWCKDFAEKMLKMITTALHPSGDYPIAKAQARGCPRILGIHEPKK
jgi:hypothetical protein